MIFFYYVEFIKIIFIKLQKITNKVNKFFELQVLKF